MGESTGTQGNSSTKAKPGTKSGAMTIKALEKIVADQGEAIEKLVAELIGPITERLGALGTVATLTSIDEATGELTVRVVELEEMYRGLAEKEYGESPVAALTKEADNLKACLSKMAHYTGGNRILDEFGIPRWEVTKESMRKGGK